MATGWFAFDTEVMKKTTSESRQMKSLLMSTIWSQRIGLCPVEIRNYGIMAANRWVM